MKNKLIIASGVALALSGQYAMAGSIADTYTTGDTLTATMMDNIKTAVNDNDSKIIFNSADISSITAAGGPVDTNTTNIATNTGDIATNTGDISDLNNTTMKVFDSSISYQIPVLDASIGSTVVNVILSNQSTTTCDAWLATSSESWNIGANSRGGLIILPTYSATNLPGVTSSGFFPLITTTYTLVSKTNMSLDVSAKTYVNLTLMRSETNASDTCNAGNVYVRGATIEYPNGSKQFIPVKEMTVN